METKIIKIPTYKTQQVKTGEIDKNIYVAVDGTEFSNERECTFYEEKLLATKSAEGLIEEIKFNDVDLEDRVITLIFNSYGVSSARFFKWKATKDENTIEKISKYLTYIFPQHNNCHDDLKSFNEGDNVLIIYWVEYEDGDYPDRETRCIKLEDTIKIIDDFSSTIKSVFKF